ncbi:MAG: hypothetical protein IJF83_06070 [Methanobrevibacter sp.]|nr:hypothetical protein [Methanobrevibacter sp.]
MDLQFLAMDENGNMITHASASCPIGRLSTVSVSLNNSALTNANEIKIRCITTSENGVCYLDNWVVKEDD